MPTRALVKRSRTPWKLKRKHLDELRNKSYAFSLEFEALYRKYVSSLSSLYAEAFRKIAGLGCIRLADLNSKIIRLAEKGDVSTLETQEEFKILDRLLWKLSALTKELVIRIDAEVLGAKAHNNAAPSSEHLPDPTPASRLKSSSLVLEQTMRENSAGAAPDSLTPSLSRSPQRASESMNKSPHVSSDPITQRINPLRKSELHDAEPKRPLLSSLNSLSPQLHTSPKHETAKAHKSKGKSHTNPPTHQTRPQKSDAQIKQELEQKKSEIVNKMRLLPLLESSNALQRHQITVLSARLGNIHQDLRALEPATPTSTITVVQKKKAKILSHLRAEGSDIKGSLIVSFPFTAITRTPKPILRTEVPDLDEEYQTNIANISTATARRKTTNTDCHISKNNETPHGSQEKLYNTAFKSILSRLQAIPAEANPQLELTKNIKTTTIEVADRLCCNPETWQEKHFHKSFDLQPTKALRQMEIETSPYRTQNTAFNTSRFK